MKQRMVWAGNPVNSRRQGRGRCLSRKVFLVALWMGNLQSYAACKITLDGVLVDTSDTNSQCSG